MENLRDLTDELARQRIDRRTFLRRAVALGLSVPAASGILAACAPAAPASAPAQAPAAPAPGGAVDLAAIAEAAKKEGRVVVAGNMLQAETSRKAVAEAFVKRYGLPSNFEVQWVAKTGALTIKQIDEELAAGKLSIDVPYHNTAAWFYDYAKAGKFLAFDPPEYAAYAKFDSKSGFNLRPYYVGDVSILATPVWNTEVIKGNEFKSWFDFLRPEYKGKIVIVSARAAPSMAVTYKGMKESPEIGKKFFEELAKLAPATLTQTDQIVQKVASGEYPLTLTGAVGRTFAMWKTQGVKHLAQSYPKEGVVPLSVNAAVMAGAPHPNAGKLFLNFLRSQEGQQTIADFEGRVSGRGDIKSQNPMFLPNIDEIKSIWVDQASIPPDEFEKLGKEWEGMFGA